VLFLDDEERILKSLKALFRSHYDVVTATDGHMALEYMKQGHVHLVVSDQRMPGMTGVEFLRKARHVSPNTMRVLLTGYSDLAAIVGSINDGEVFRFINKPWDSEAIQKTIGEGVDIGVRLANASAPASGAVGRVQTMAEPLLVISSYKPLHEEVSIIAKGACDIVRVRTLREALEVLKFSDIRVIVAESSPENDDITLCLRLLKQKYPHIVTILISPTADAEMAISLINQAQLFRFLVPPVSAEALKSSIDAAIGHAMSLKASPQLAAKHVVQVEPEQKRSSLTGWLFEGLHGLPTRFGRS
jgi:serine/threonine-protein kinase